MLRRFVKRRRRIVSLLARKNQDYSFINYHPFASEGHNKNDDQNDDRLEKKTNIFDTSYKIQLSQIGLAMSRQNEVLGQANDRKRLRGDSDIRHAIRVPKHVSPEDSKIIQQIHTCNKPLSLLTVVKQNQKSITHPSVYGKAMKKCKSLKGWDQVEQIMLLALESSVMLSDIIFNILFDCLAHSDAPERCIKYLNIMIEKYNIKPDNLTFSSLIKGCKFQASYRYKLAEHYWSLISKYNIIPDYILYSDMINVCARANNVQRATEIFHEFLRNHKHQISKEHLPLFTSYLMIFCRRGDIDGMESVIKMLQQFNLESNVKSNVVVISNKMRCYHAARDYNKALDVYTEYVDNGGIVNEYLVNQKCVCLSSIIINDFENKCTFEQKEKMYLEIEDMLYRQCVICNIPVTPTMVDPQLSAAIGLYRFVNPAKAVSIFKQLAVHQPPLIGYKKYDKITKSIAIDLHMFIQLTAQFILRYVIGFELNELLKTSDVLILIVGIGKHSNQKGALKSFIAKELLTYKPPIVAKQLKCNPGCLMISKAQLLPYLNSEMNYAKHTLEYPSGDWYIGDVRKRM